MTGRYRIDVFDCIAHPDGLGSDGKITTSRIGTIDQFNCSSTSNNLDLKVISPSLYKRRLMHVPARNSSYRRHKNSSLSLVAVGAVYKIILFKRMSNYNVLENVTDTRTYDSEN
jgi:hypothetical protein